MLQLGGRAIEIRGATNEDRLVLKLTENPELPLPLRRSRAYLIRDVRAPWPTGYTAYFTFSPLPTQPSKKPAPAIQLPKFFEYLGDGDIVRVHVPQGDVRVMFRAKSAHNFLLVTEQCNSYCLMCSQPPKTINDSWILGDLREVIRLISPDIQELGFTGGEPFLFGEEFLELLRLAKNLLPRTAIHILSNGRLFCEKSFARQYASIDHPDMMVGIPLYSDDASIHDYVVQARGAFDETIRGILNLKELRQQVEIRVVLHKQTIPRLTRLAEFICRNLLFVDQVALMGLEITGFTRANLQELWMDPFNYRKQLSEAVEIFEAYQVPVSIYNHQLCTVEAGVWRHCTQSISDWKNEYLPVCNDCSVKHQCGGFFSSAVQYKHSDHIHAL
jgi:His-Xaa-Ser system radical SAM maturase HxsC